jgi:hypothetical protein
LSLYFIDSYEILKEIFGIDSDISDIKKNEIKIEIEENNEEESININNF